VQSQLIDAAVAAGVARFIPSEFGSDLMNARARTLPIYRFKIAAQDRLLELAAQGQMSYTLLMNGPFLDWGMKRGLLLDVPARKAVLYDGGERTVSTSRLQTVGKAVVGVLEHLEETRNRAVYVKDLDVTQRQLLEMGKKATPPGEEWDVREMQTAELEQEAYEALKTEKPNMAIMSKFLLRAIFGEGYGSRFEKTDNGLLGIPYMTTEELEELVGETVKEGSAS
jgi:NmrA-like family